MKLDLVREDLGKACVSISEIRAFNKCRLAWAFAHGKTGLGRPVELMQQPTFWLGVGVHHSIQHYHEGQEKVHPRNLFMQWAKETSGETLPHNLRYAFTDGVTLCENYHTWFSTSMLRKVVFQQWETPFRLAVKNSAGQTARTCFSGRIDALAHYDRGFWIVEYKTSSNPAGFSDSLRNDLQATAYQWLMRELGHKVNGTLYILLSKKSSGPRVVMEGVARTGAELNRFGDYLYTVIQEITNPEVSVYPTDGEWTCKSCDFKEPCDAWWRMRL